MYGRVAALAIAVVTWSGFMTSSSAVEVKKKAEVHAKRLHDDKLTNGGYNKLIRPVGNASESLTVDIGLRLTSIIDVVSLSFSSSTFTLSRYYVL